MLQGYAHPRQQLFDAKRLGQIIIRALVQGQHLVAFAVAHRQHNDRRLGPLAQLFAHGEPIHIRQAQVEDDHVRRLGRRQGQALVAPAGDSHLELPGGQDRAQGALDLRLIVDDQDVRCTCGCTLRLHSGLLRDVRVHTLPGDRQGEIENEAARAHFQPKFYRRALR